FESAAMTYFMGTGTFMNFESAHEQELSAQFLHDPHSVQKRNFNFAAIRTSILLMRHIQTAHHMEMVFLEKKKKIVKEITSGQSAIIFALPDISQFKHSCSLLFQALNLSQKRILINQLEKHSGS
ncbi:MAG: hypothetical protein HY255_02180, partial [Betaproteobacteria bacterium]|nr:hypothetical protein [Betaproteobacteria bacterium]